MQTLDKAHTRARIEGMAAAAGATLNITDEARELAHFAQQGEEPGLQTLTPPTIGAYWPEAGGTYAGIARGVDGEPDAHLVLHPACPPTLLAWRQALEWAADLGEGWHVPTGDESALLYAHLRGHVAFTMHWTSTCTAPQLAMLQSFETGSQLNYAKHWNHGSARAVRRIPVRRFWPITPAAAPQTPARATAPAEVAL